MIADGNEASSNRNEPSEVGVREHMKDGVNLFMNADIDVASGIVCCTCGCSTHVSV